MKNSRSVVVKQEEPEIPAEVMAKAIVEISDGMKKMLRAGLKQKTIVILVSVHTGVSRTNVENVINCLESLRDIYCTK